MRQHSFSSGALDPNRGNVDRDDRIVDGIRPPERSVAFHRVSNDRRNLGDARARRIFCRCPPFWKKTPGSVETLTLFHPQNW